MMRKVLRAGLYAIAGVVAVVLAHVRPLAAAHD